MDGTEEMFDVESLVDKGLKIDEIEALLAAFVEEYDEEIESFDFHLNVEALADEIDQRTRRLLG